MSTVVVMMSTEDSAGATQGGLGIPEGTVPPAPDQLGRMGRPPGSQQLAEEPFSGILDPPVLRGATTPPGIAAGRAVLSLALPPPLFLPSPRSRERSSVWKDLEKIIN